MVNILSAIMYAFGYATGLLAFAYFAKRRGMATEGIWALMIAGLIGGLAGANLVQLMATATAGKTILGAVACGYLAVVYAKKRLGIRRPTGDLFAFGISAGEAVGRFGCLLAGCCYGKETSVPWAVWQHDAYRHPTQIYLSLAAALTFLILVQFQRLKPPENATFFLQGVIFCTLRFAVEFFRAGGITVGSLTESQWACIAGTIFFALMLAKTMRANDQVVATCAPSALRTLA
jgi:phosphatidylglycerol---prolipoprotein diacylglyceryl transferase